VEKRSEHAALRAAAGLNDAVVPAYEREHFERTVLGIDVPDVRDTVLRVDLALLAAVE
jgi:hypothetical protein